MPTREVMVTSPSRRSCPKASRIGVRLTPGSVARPSMESLTPGWNSPL